MAKTTINKTQDFDLIVLDLFLSTINVADGASIKNLCDVRIKECPRVIYTGYPEQNFIAEYSKWAFIAKQETKALEKLLKFARAAYSKAQSLPSPNVEQARRIVNSMRPDSWDNLYILGCFDQRITLYSQQARALTLIRALFEIGQLHRGSSLAVVGAGVAGATAAVAGALLEARVTLFDRAEGPFHLQENASHRYLHPHIYDWPEPGSLEKNANLPFLNWSANTADKVVDVLRKDFNNFRDYFSSRRNRFQWKNSTQVTAVEKISSTKGATSKILLKSHQLKKPNTISSQKYDVVILAIGYGVESETPYWSGDNVAGPFHHKPKNEQIYRILVSGIGDGGLIDLARATLRTDSRRSTFRHDQAVQFITKGTDFGKLGERMLEIDKVALGEELYTPVNLYNRYKALKVPKEIVKKLNLLKRGQTDVTFHYRKENPFKLNTALLNRLLAYLLLKYKLVTFRFGKMKEKPTAANTKIVTFERPDGSKTEMKFNLIIKRYGPPKTYFEESFENVFRDCGPLKDMVKLRLIERLDEETLEFWNVIRRSRVKL